MLSEFIATNRQEIIGRCRAKVAVRPTAPGTKPKTDHGVPVFLDQLVTALRLGLTSNTEITTSAVFHGRDLLVQGFSVSQVVHDYGDVCQSVTELAVEQDAPISTQDFRILNRCLDDAIAGAVTEYGRSRDDAINRHADDEIQRLVALTTKLQTAIQMANMARDVVKTGSVGISGSTSSLLDMSLHAASGLVDGLLAEFSAKRTHSEPDLALPRVGAERPSVTEDDRGPRAPVFVVDLRAVPRDHRLNRDAHDLSAMTIWNSRERFSVSKVIRVSL